MNSVGVDGPAASGAKVDAGGPLSGAAVAALDLLGRHALHLRV
jgi:hypothetical protein